MPCDLDTRIVAPVRGIADFVFDSLQLDEGLFLGRRGHPSEALNIGGQSGFDGVHHLDGAGLAFGRKGAVYVSLAERFSEIAVGGTDATPPARLLLLGAGQGVGEEVPV